MFAWFSGFDWVWNESLINTGLRGEVSRLIMMVCALARSFDFTLVFVASRWNWLPRRVKVMLMMVVVVTGECKAIIASYLQCLKSAGGVNDERCRKLAKGYLGCRMDKCVS